MQQIKVVTPLLIVLAVFVGISGVLMFFHVKSTPVVAMHEWLGVAFVVFVLLHAFSYIRGVKSYFSDPRSLTLMITAAVVGALFYLGVPEQPNAVRMVVGKMLQAPLELSAPVLGLTPQAAVDRLQVGGFAQASSARSIDDIAKADGKEFNEVLLILMAR